MTTSSADAKHLSLLLQCRFFRAAGDNGPKHFKQPYIFSELYVDWANKWGFDGELHDMDIAVSCFPFCCQFTAAWTLPRILMEA